MNVIDLLIDHYSRLLHAEGNDYPDLIKDAYKVRESYKAYLHRLSTAEQAVDHAISEIRGEVKEIMEQLQMEQVQVTELRTKEVNRVFSRTGE